MSGKAAELISAFKQQLLADSKKSALLGGLFLVLLVVVGRALFVGPEPATVDASSTAVLAVKAVPGGGGSQASKDPVTPKMRPTPKGPATPGSVSAPRRSTHRRDAGATRADHRRDAGATRADDRRDAGATRLRRAVSIDKLPRTLQRDLFNTTAWSSFTPSSVLDQPVQGKEGASGQFWLGLVAAIGERQKARQEELTRLEEELAGLELKSTMTGSVPMAYISETLVREGDTIDGFSVVRIKDRRVTVRKSGFIRELVMP